MATAGIQNGRLETRSRNNFWTERDGEAISAATPTFSTMPDSDMPLTTWPDVGLHEKRKMARTQTRSRNNLWTGRNGNVISAAPHHFQSPPTQICHWRHGPTSADIGNTKWRRHKLEVEITFEWEEMATRFQRLPHIFDHPRLRYAIDDMDQGLLTSVVSTSGLYRRHFLSPTSMWSMAYLSRALSKMWG